MTDLLHPITGKPLEDDDATLIAVVQEVDASLREIYGLARPVRERRDELTRLLADRGSYELPPARNRTTTQERVARCPRCGDPLPEPA